MPDPRSLYLVSTDWLAENLNNQSMQILDVTAMLTKDLQNLAQERVFDEGHIPGAAFLDVASGWGILADPDAKLPFTWPSSERVEAAMSDVGVNNDTRVILYAGSPRPGVDFGPMWATRAWWLLHHFGVNCAVLNGGYEKWVAEMRPTTTSSNGLREGNFTAKSDGRHSIAAKEDVLASTEDVATCIIDSLAAESYSGAKPLGSVQRNGHITGAVNVPMHTLVGEQMMTFADNTTLSEKFSRAGVDLDLPIITYCGGGIAATLDAFALTLLGAFKVRVYDGSLSEWSADASMPMSTVT